MRTVIPYANRVVTKLRVPPEVTAGGIILTQKSQQSTEAIVVESGIEDIVQGDVLIFYPGSGVEISVDGEHYLILNDKEIMAVVHGS